MKNEERNRGKYAKNHATKNENQEQDLFNPMRSLPLQFYQFDLISDQPTILISDQVTILMLRYILEVLRGRGIGTSRAQAATLARSL